VHLAGFHPNQMLDDYLAAQSDAEYNNLELALLWLDHFHNGKYLKYPQYLLK
jgi:hypothetical protein